MCRQACILGVTAKIDDDSVPGIGGIYIYPRYVVPGIGLGLGSRQKFYNISTGTGTVGTTVPVW